MAEVLFLSTILFPLIGGAIMLVFMRGEDRHWQIAVSSIIMVFSLLMIVVSIMEHAPPATFCISWLASAGPMCVTFERSALTIILFSSIPLLIILVNRSSSISSVVERGLLLIAYSNLQVALISDHFMLRYAALEFVGLCITAAALLFTSPKEKRWSSTKQVFINLRIGDLALLVAIFLMFTISGSFGIAKNFDNALLGSTNIQLIVSACLLTAIWVKMAVWPLNRWRGAAGTIGRSSRLWLLDICTPLLGAYLLYRSAPLLENQQAPLFPAVLAVACLAAIILQSHQANKHNLQRRNLQLTSIGLILAGFWVNQKSVWTFMIMWLVLRISYFALHELTIEKKSTGAQWVAPEAIHFLLAQGFSFLIFWRITSRTDLPSILSVTMWGLWWTQAIVGGITASEIIQGSVCNTCGNAKASAVVKSFKTLFVGTAIFAANFLATSFLNIRCKRTWL